jgi:hypothetical protein
MNGGRERRTRECLLTTDSNGSIYNVSSNFGVHILASGAGATRSSHLGHTHLYSWTWTGRVGRFGRSAIPSHPQLSNLNPSTHPRLLFQIAGDLTHSPRVTLERRSLGEKGLYACTECTKINQKGGGKRLDSGCRMCADSFWDFVDRHTAAWSKGPRPGSPKMGCTARGWMLEFFDGVALDAGG